MQEKFLIKISYLITIIGLAFLFFYVQKLDLPLLPDLESVASSEQVFMKGTIKGLKVTDQAVFFELEGEKIVKTDIILFPESSIYLREGDHVEITGQVEEYKGEKEVIADTIILK